MKKYFKIFLFLFCIATVSTSVFSAYVSSDYETPNYWPKDKEEFDGFPVKEFTDMLVFGFSEIDRYFIEDISRKTFFDYAIQSMKATVPDVSATLAGDSVLMHIGTDMIANVKAPIEDDLLGWARLTTSIILKLRQYSEKLKNANKEQLYYVIFSYVLKRLDENSNYVHITEQVKEDYKRNAVASAGINYRRVKGGNIQVTRVFYETPAYFQNFDEGDLITHINSKPVTKMKDEEIGHYLYGEPNSIVGLKVITYRTKEVKDKYLRLVSINPSTVSVRVEDKIAYFIIHTFNSSTKNLIMQSVDQVKSELGDHLKGFVIDLRSNGGGDVNYMTEVADLFLNKDVIFKSKGKVEEATNTYTATAGEIFSPYPVVFIVNNATASSAEFLTASVLEHGKAVVIGTPTYGKGTLQTRIDLPNGSYMMFSWAKAFTPYGHTIHKLGVLPVICSTTVGTEEMIDVMFDRIRDDYFVSKIYEWRKLGATEKNKEERDKIREACPFIKPSNAQYDLTDLVAKKIINNTDVYNKLIEMQLKDLDPKDLKPIEKEETEEKKQQEEPVISDV